MPLIDSVVLRNAGLKLPTSTAPHRVDRIVHLHQRLAEMFSAYLNTDRGRYLVTRFEKEYPETGLTEVKMPDLILWQTRDEHTGT